MTISDFKQGTTNIKICRSWFKCEEQFEEILIFLELPTDCVSVELEVSKETEFSPPSYIGKRFRK